MTAFEPAQKAVPISPAAVPGTFQKDKSRGFRKLFFSFSGRIGRLSFLLRLLVVTGMLLGVYAINFFIISRLSFYLLAEIIFIVIQAVMVLIFSGLSIVSVLSLTSRRLHDMNYSGKWLILFLGLDFAVLAIIPGIFVLFFVNLFYLLPLLLIPGSRGKNKYGFGSVKNMLAEFD